MAAQVAHVVALLRGLSLPLYEMKLLSGARTLPIEEKKRAISATTPARRLSPGYVPIGMEAAAMARSMPISSISKANLLSHRQRKAETVRKHSKGARHCGGGARGLFRFSFPSKPPPPKKKKKKNAHPVSVLCHYLPDDKLGRALLPHVLDKDGPKRPFDCK